MQGFTMVVYISAGTYKYIHAVIYQAMQCYCITVHYTSNTSAWLQSLSVAPSQFFQMVTESIKLTVIWCLHGGKFSVLDQRLTRSVASEAKTSSKDAAREQQPHLCSLGEPSAKSAEAAANHCNLWPSLHPWPAQLLEGDGVYNLWQGSPKVRTSAKASETLSNIRTRRQLPPAGFVGAQALLNWVAPLCSLQDRRMKGRMKFHRSFPFPSPCRSRALLLSVGLTSICVHGLILRKTFVFPPNHLNVWSLWWGRLALLTFCVVVIVQRCVGPVKLSFGRLNAVLTAAVLHSPKLFFLFVCL